MWVAYYRGKEVVPADWAAGTRAPGVETDGKPIWLSEAGGAKGPWLTGAGGSDRRQLFLPVDANYFCRCGGLPRFEA